jgi:hypothetical protein
MKPDRTETACLRELAKRYMDASASQEHERTKELWRRLHDRRMQRPMIYIWVIIFTDEFEEVANPVCRHPLFREAEKRLRIDLCHHSTGDDYLLEPFIDFWAVRKGMENGPWGIRTHIVESKGGAYKAYADPPLKDLADLSLLRPAGHHIDEAATAVNLSLLQDAIGDILPVSVIRQPHYSASFPVFLPHFRGLEQVMIDMVDNPADLHRLLEKMLATTLAAMDRADAAGDYRTADASVQSAPYSSYTPDPFPVRPARRQDLWCFAQAQDFTLISPQMHDEFALRYQQPIMEQFAASAYGCCEDLTRKIDILRKVKNLKMISVAPAANLEKCAEQIGSDYVVSWRPNPTDQVCTSFDHERIRRTIREGCQILNRNGCHYEINLKDVVSLCGERERLREWVSIVREVIGGM